VLLDQYPRRGQRQDGNRKVIPRRRLLHRVIDVQIAGFGASVSGVGDEHGIFDRQHRRNAPQNPCMGCPNGDRDNAVAAAVACTALART
jgi:hypothetical protein